MTHALLYQSENNWRFGAALAAAAVIHLAAMTFAKVRTDSAGRPPTLFGESTTMEFEPAPPADAPVELSEPLPSPAAVDETFQKDNPPLPSVRQQPTKATPLARPRRLAAPGALDVSAARVLAVSAPRPEYPYEARRQKITGEGIVAMTVDPATGMVSHVSITKSTGSTFLDNAALTGFRRWRFKPGTVTSVACPVTFTLTGASY